VVAFNQSKRAVTIRDMSMIVGIVVTAVLFSDWLGAAVPGIPSVLWLTTIMLGVAQVPFVRRLSGAPMLGNYVLHLFLATIGAQSIFAEIMRVGPAVFYFTLVVVGVHGLVVFGAGRMLGLSLPTLVVASQANVGGRRRQWLLPPPRDTPTASYRVWPLGCSVTPLGITPGYWWLELCDPFSGRDVGHERANGATLFHRR
jgi:hypothetical protein